MDQRAPRLHPRIVDALVVALAALPGVIGVHLLAMAVPDDVINPLVAAVLVALQAGVLWWRRRWPLAVLLATLAVLALSRPFLGESADTFVGPFAAAYAVAVYGRGRAPAAGLAAVAVVAVADTVVANLATTGATLLDPIGLLIAAAWGVGRYVRVRRDHLDTLVAYARQLEIDRDERAHRAVLDERRRIARELHDQVAHHLGIAALHTAAARRWLGRDGARARAAMTSAEDAVRGALTTMPVILQALRADDATADLAPQPTLDDLDRLVAHVADAGPRVELRAEGDRARLDPAVELAAYRVVQEALTNTLRHADATHARVLLRWTPERLEVEVTDDGAGATAPGDGAGLGLVGMRERVEVLGGVLDVGRRDGGRFAVRAALPLAAPRRAAAMPPGPDRQG